MIVCSRYSACLSLQNGGHKWILSGVRRGTPASSRTTTKALVVGLHRRGSFSTHTYVIQLLAIRFLGLTNLRITSATEMGSDSTFLKALLVHVEVSSMHTPSRYFSQHLATSVGPTINSPRQAASRARVNSPMVVSSILTALATTLDKIGNAVLRVGHWILPSVNPLGLIGSSLGMSWTQPGDRSHSASP